ncbi:tripartite tricarboxylate transporter substrate binding protein [Teichococcus vastitatis]|uniref:Tripartite tricarboxylate transporter substrate binding protein n=1 Tax=Teichococcus vastitatis TaxID=2307076 RepID=A0ABS9VZC3_9PROT|nr:tripartite tricarboxylate transporter substrate binding protein [Pseudoroseomonas vastitatis]MCI0752345.1 tripartite tricarboxylate transporter substrate binding protein [Pseudoroseomonas vastitatis]
MMSSNRRALLAAASTLLTTPSLVRAQPDAAALYPDRPVRFIVPFPPGQAADIFGRLMADELSKRWPQRVVVENRSGGAGALGMEAGARAAPDGYTLVVGTSGTLGVNPSLVPNLPYDAERDFAAVTNIFTLPLVLVAHPGAGLDDLPTVLDRARERPGALNYASAGPGTAQHMAMEMLAHRAGVRLTHVPYRGSGPAMADLIAGNVPLMMDSLASALPQVQSGRARAVATTGRARPPQLASTATVAEAGLTGYEALGWSGLVAPAATPPKIIRRINADAVAILRDPVVAGRMAELGGFADPGSPEQFASFIRDEISKWRKVAKEAGVRLEG